MHTELVKVQITTPSGKRVTVKTLSTIICSKFIDNLYFDRSSILLMILCIVPESFFLTEHGKKKLCQNFKIYVSCDLKYLAAFNDINSKSARADKMF